MASTTTQAARGTKMGRITPEDELVLRLIVMTPRPQGDFPGLWEDMRNPDRVECEKAMKDCGRAVPGRFNGWGGQVRLAQKKLIEIQDQMGKNGKMVPMYVGTQMGKEFVAALDEGKKPKAAGGTAPPKE